MTTIFEHLTQTYKAAEAAHPDLLEPYSVMLVDAEDREQHAAIMRRGLRETFRRRFPMPDDFWPKAQEPVEASAS